MFLKHWQYGSIAWDKGFALNRWQVIIWINVGMLYWCIYASLGLNELNNEHPAHGWAAILYNGCLSNILCCTTQKFIVSEFYSQ